MSSVLASVSEALTIKVQGFGNWELQRVEEAVRKDWFLGMWSLRREQKDGCCLDSDREGEGEGEVEENADEEKKQVYLVQARDMANS